MRQKSTAWILLNSAQKLKEFFPRSKLGISIRLRSSIRMRGAAGLSAALWAGIAVLTAIVAVTHALGCSYATTSAYIGRKTAFLPLFVPTVPSRVGRAGSKGDPGARCGAASVCPLRILRRTRPPSLGDPLNSGILPLEGCRTPTSRRPLIALFSSDPGRGGTGAMVRLFGDFCVCDCV